MNIAYDAMIFAFRVHEGQKRKYTGNPYTDHLAEVAGITATVVNYDYAIAIAWLHDCVEDCGISQLELEEKFDYDIAMSVIELSDLEIGNRQERKKLSRERLSKCHGYVQTIKVADLISNTSSIVQHDPKFSKVYLEEKRLLLDVLTKADKRLIQLAKDIIQ